MTRTKRRALAFYIGAMAAGAAIGITVDRWILRDQLMEELGNEGSMRKTFADRLRLDSVQRVALDTILDARNLRYDEIMAPVRPELHAVRDEARAQIRQLLTPEQQAIYDKIQRER